MARTHSPSLGLGFFPEIGFEYPCNRREYNTPILYTDDVLGGSWFSVAVTAFVTSTKLSYVEPVLGLATTFGGSTIHLFIQATQAHSAWPSLREYRCNEYRRWFWPSRGINGASEVTTLWLLINQKNIPIGVACILA